MDKDLKKAKQEIEVILKKYNCEMKYKLSFPQYNPDDMPAFIQLAMLVISKEKFKVEPVLTSLGDKNDN